MYFIIKFYEHDPYDSSRGMFYSNKRESIAIFKGSPGNKLGLYNIKCIDIIPLNEYKYCGIAGGNHYQYYKYQKFVLRKHKYNKFYYVAGFPKKVGFDGFERIESKDLLIKYFKEININLNI